MPEDALVSLPAESAEQHRKRRAFIRTAGYLSATETHTYAFSIAAHALLSFFPFVVFLLTFTRYVLRSRALYRGLLTLLASYLPLYDGPGTNARGFVMNNLRLVVEHHHERAQVYSLLILLATCTGIFLPLEVALNRIWRSERDRSYLGNWAVSLGLAFSCGLLGMLSASFTAITETYSLRLQRFLLIHAPLPLEQWLPWVHAFSVLLIRLTALPLTVAVFFLVYWRLPNAHVPARKVFPAALFAACLWEASIYIYIALLPRLNFRDVYGPFAISVSLLIWAFCSALIVLAGAELFKPDLDALPR